MTSSRSHQGWLALFRGDSIGTGEDQPLHQIHQLERDMKSRYQEVRLGKEVLNQNEVN